MGNRTKAFDRLDYQIMSLLAEDGRYSCAEMGRRLNQPARTIRFRLDNLIRSGALAVRPIIDPAAFGFDVLADVLIRVNAGAVLEVAQSAAALDQVSYVACSTGDSDVSVQVLARDVEGLYKFVTEELHTIPGVRGTTTVLLPLKLKDIYDWQPPIP